MSCILNKSGGKGLACLCSGAHIAVRSQARCVQKQRGGGLTSLGVVPLTRSQSLNSSEYQIILSSASIRALDGETIPCMERREALCIIEVNAGTNSSAHTGCQLRPLKLLKSGMQDIKAHHWRGCLPAYIGAGHFGTTRPYTFHQCHH